MNEKPLLIGQLAKLSGVRPDAFAFMSGAGSFRSRRERRAVIAFMMMLR